MARARNIKPGFYKDESLADCSAFARLLAPGLWMLADREGRLEDRPKRIKAELLPYDDVDIDDLLRELAECGHIQRYRIGEAAFIRVVNFAKHQNPHKNESESIIPPPPLDGALAPKPEVLAPLPEQYGTAPADSLLLIPSSLNPSTPTPPPARTREEWSPPPPQRPEPPSSRLHQEVREFIVRRLPHLAGKVSRDIDEWIAQGCDPAEDIYPSVQGLIDQQRGNIGSFKYFTHAILSAKAAREEKEAQWKRMEEKFR